MPTVPATGASGVTGSGRVPELRKAKLEIEGGGEITCWFNPKDYTVSKSNEWTVKPVVGQPLPTVQFGGGQARELSLDLLFDATDYPARTVAGVCTELFRMMEVRAGGTAGASKNTKRPPKVKFTWGETVSFEAVAKQLSVQYLLFRSDGSPIRAQAKLSLVQVGPDRNEGRPPKKGELDPPPQNPTTRGIAGLRTHVLRDGDSLQSIAYAHYGDATAWRRIAEVNAIGDAMRLPPRGTTLAIPRIEE